MGLRAGRDTWDMEDGRNRGVVMANDRIGKVSMFDPSISSEDTSTGSNLGNLSYLKGSNCSNDMSNDSMYGMYDYQNYMRRRALRRHTVEQGLSTFVKGVDFS